MIFKGDHIPNLYFIMTLKINTGFVMILRPSLHFKVDKTVREFLRTPCDVYNIICHFNNTCP